MKGGAETYLINGFRDIYRKCIELDGVYFEKERSLLSYLTATYICMTSCKWRQRDPVHCLFV